MINHFEPTKFERKCISMLSVKQITGRLQNSLMLVSCNTRNLIYFLTSDNSTNAKKYQKNVNFNHENNPLVIG